ncbi:MAG: pilus assembly protein PilM [Culicoidibacterales bacterium]
MDANQEKKSIWQSDINEIVQRLKEKKSNKTKSGVKFSPKKRIGKKPNELVVFDIGSSVTKVIVGKYSQGNMTIKTSFTLATPIGSMKDGAIVNETLITEMFEQIVKEYKLKAKHAVITMNSSQVINRDIFIPIVEGDEIETVIRYELQQYLPINLDEYQIRYLVTDIVNEENKQRIFVSVFPERILRTYYQILKKVDLQPYSLELPIVALRKLVAHNAKINEVALNTMSTIGWIDFGESTINVSVQHNSNIDFTRLIRKDEYTLEEALKLEGYEREKIYEMKHTLNVLDETFAVEHPIMKHSLDQIAGEIEKFIQFYRNTNQNRTIEMIYLYGGIGQIQGLAQYLEQVVKTPIQLVETVTPIQQHSKSELDNIASYLNAVSSLVRVEG